MIATGRSDYPNQINNVLAFPGVFRGALDVRAREITEAMKVAAAQAIAADPRAEELSPTTSCRASSTETSLRPSPRQSQRPPRNPASLGDHESARSRTPPICLPDRSS